MKSECLDLITIQAYLDGELPVLEMETAAAHVSTCAACGETAREMEAEFFAIGQAFEPELTLPVPTAQLRARVNAAIDALPSDINQIGDSDSLWARLRAWVGSLTPQLALGMASAIVVMALIAGVAIAMVRSNRSDSGAMIAAINLKPEGDLPAWTVVDEPLPPVVNPPDSNRGQDVQVRPHRPPVNIDPNVIDTPAPLPGEATYLATIGEMNHSLSQRDDLNSQPTARADIERNLAVLDQAIATSQEQARRNPKDKNAAEFLYTAYQNKVEFLRTVSDQAQLYAALR